MPTYEYECTKCPRVFEVRQRITEPALTTCDICGGPVRRLLAAAPFILKGEGWYVTDYPSEARKKAQGAESATKPSTSAESKTGTESSTGAAGTSSEPGSSGSTAANGASAPASKPSPDKSSSGS